MDGEIDLTLGAKNTSHNAHLRQLQRGSGFVAAGLQPWKIALHEHRALVDEAATATRAWLIQNNGDVVPPNIVAEISPVGGCENPAEWWVGQIGPTGFFIPDDAIDWIEELANDDDPANP